MDTQEKLAGMLRLEMAASDWFRHLSPQERQTYLRSHPHSRLAGRVIGETRAFGKGLSTLGRAGRAAVREWDGLKPRERIEATRHALLSGTRVFGHHTVHVVKHEAHMYAGAGRAVHHLIRGRGWRSLDAGHKRHLRNALIHAGLTAGSLAVGDASGHSGAAVAHLITEFAHAHAHHAVMLGSGEAVVRTGRDALRGLVQRNKSREAAALDDTAARVRDAALRTAYALAQHVPIDEWVAVVSQIERGRAPSAP